MIDVLHSYRRNCSTQSSPGQLVLPEALKLAPLYHLCLQKCPAFRCALARDALWPPSACLPPGASCWLSSMRQQLSLLALLPYCCQSSREHLLCICRKLSV